MPASQRGKKNSEVSTPIPTELWNSAELHNASQPNSALLSLYSLISMCKNMSSVEPDHARLRRESGNWPWKPRLRVSRNQVSLARPAFTSRPWLSHHTLLAYSATQCHYHLAASAAIASRKFGRQKMAFSLASTVGFKGTACEKQLQAVSKQCVRDSRAGVLSCSCAIAKQANSKSSVGSRD